MKMKIFRQMAAAVLSATIALTASATGQKADGVLPARFETGKGRFLADGVPVTVKAAELHYPRIPRAYWEQRLKMVKALGMNAVCLYVFWNFHEQEPGRFDFAGQKDLREFVELCRDNGLMVILRPGPYVCAEWEMGGLPWWLLRDKDIALRENDPRFLTAVERFMEQVAGQVGDLTVDKGGPIVMVQVENEYGSYGIDKEYIANVRDIVRKNFGEDVLLFQCDWSSNFTDNGLDDLLWTLNFGTGADVDREFAPLKELRPDSPLMCSEFWSGWFDKWGAGHETRPAEDMISGMEQMLRNDISFSLYMTHGGTNWGHWAGANSPGFAPDVTSYDYDAPINEYGYPTPKFFKLREMMKRYGSVDSLPEMIPVGEIAEFRAQEVAPLMPAGFRPAGRFERVPGMEELGQGFGSVLYSTDLPAGSDLPCRLLLPEVGDYAQVWLDGKSVGKVDRRLGENELTLPPYRRSARIDILVEAMGRINFGRAIKDFKGLGGEVALRGDDGELTPLEGWETALLPDEYEYYNSLEFKPITSGDSLAALVRTALDASAMTGDGGRLPGVYRARFEAQSGADTFLDMSGWGKGLVYVNGHGLGRFWEIGPQQTLYLPGCYLRDGDNEVIVVDVVGPADLSLRGLAAPVLDRLGGSAAPDLTDPARLDALPSDENMSRPSMRASLERRNGWQTFTLPAPLTGRYASLTLTPADDITEGEADVVSLAEIKLLDADGNQIDRAGWRPYFVSSQELAGNHTLDKLIDLQESTYWQSTPSVAPSELVIDLGADRTVAAIRLLPRMDSSVSGIPSTFTFTLR